MIVSTATQSSRDNAEIVGLRSAGSSFNSAGSLARGDVHLQADLLLGGQRAAQHQRDRLDLLALPLVRPRLLVGDELRVARHDGLDDPQVVGLQRRAGLGQLDNRIDQLRRLHFRRAPGELHFRRHAVLLQPAARHLDQLGRDAFALQILDRLDGGIVRHRQHPAGGIGRLLAVGDLADDMHVAVVLRNPVRARQARRRESRARRSG